MAGERSILVTGGTGALGQAVVAHGLEAGYQVHVTWVVRDEVRFLEQHLGDSFGAIQLHEADVTQEDQVAALFAAVTAAGPLWAVANIVGGFAYASLSDTDFETWRRMMEMNATSCFLCCREAAKVLKANGGGRIVNVAAMPALARGAAFMSAYAASKAAVLNLTQSLAEELAPDGITVNSIVPSIIDTPANRQAMPDADTSSWLPPKEIAGAMGFLMSDAARIVNGSALALSLG
ncbi:MAG: SDR family NAD(P)-dependent oxidoreductase [Deltaproteobacteria bacterium]|nr:SDR family NAD(P)-dependent oxidoreductase [Deltaproteobacteria bacterium]